MGEPLRKWLLKPLLLVWAGYVLYEWASPFLLGPHGSDDAEATRLFTNYQYFSDTIANLSGLTELGNPPYLEQIRTSRWQLLKGMAWAMIVSLALRLLFAKGKAQAIKHLAIFVLVKVATFIAFMELGRITWNMTKTLTPEAQKDHYKVFFNPEYPALLQSAVRWFTLAGVALLTK